jgi:hypothetical protein
MKIVINNNGEHTPATLEVVDGVMIVSPVKGKDIAQFKDGDVVIYHYDEDVTTIAILRGEVFTVGDCLFIEDYVSLDSVEGLLLDSNYTNAATDVRYATEGEKQQLFDALAKEGKAWDAEKKAVVELKWKPKYGEKYYYPYFNIRENYFMTQYAAWSGIYSEENGYSKGWCFKTIEECGEFCQKLNKAIMEVKP